jgi:hypothetical protein
MYKILEYEICYCKMCNERYSDSKEEFKPHILSCGNTVCKTCMKKLIDSNAGKCFFSNDHSHKDEKTLPPINYAFIDILQDFQKSFQRIEKEGRIPFNKSECK